MRVARAGFEDDIVNEAALRVGLETSAKHAQVILARREEVFYVERYSHLENREMWGTPFQDA
jgi:hypothetical protein